MTGGRQVGPVTGLAFVALAALAALLCTAPTARADDDRRAPRRPLLPQYQQECAACHIAYPPDLLPAESWRHLMTGLAQHFGTDAALDAASTQAIAGWLAANAADAGSGTDARTRSPQRPAAPPPNLRITRSAWFVSEHGEVSAAVWKRPSVKSPANCQACHRQADQGDFNERNIRIPG
jgi:mono/diheme cytochrome c family protein